MEDARNRMEEWPTGRLLSTAARLVEHAWADALDRLDLTHAGLIALHLLAEGPLNQTELSRRARVQTQTMSRTIDRLERGDLVTREHDPHDRRRQIVRRTDAGEAVWLSARTVEADLFPALDDPEALRAALLAIITTASDQRWDDE